MIELIRKEDCSGCEACVNVCPVNAICMTRDYEGFDYPKVDLEKCIKCDKCDTICPIKNHDKYNAINNKSCIYKNTYAAKNPNEKVRRKSSSGGMFYLIAEKFIEEGNVVVGAAFDDSFNVHHIMVEDQNGLEKLIGSKYVQSKIGGILKEVKEILLEGRKVLFTGMSCQIEGLKAFLGAEYSGLFCVDLICMGIPSPGIWRKYIDNCFPKKISSINFKDKSRGWHMFSFLIKYDDGSSFSQIGFNNFYMQAMFKGYSLRPSCFECKFKNEVKCADITLADCWGCEKYLPYLDDNKGLSMVIVHTKKGNEIIEELKKNISMKEIDYKNVLLENVNYYKSSKPIKGRKIFIKLINIFPPIIPFYFMCRNPSRTLTRRMFSKIKGAIYNDKKNI